MLLLQCQFVRVCLKMSVVECCCYSVSLYECVSQCQLLNVAVQCQFVRVCFTIQLLNVAVQCQFVLVFHNVSC